MGHAARYLKAFGQDCTIFRDKVVTTKVSKKRSTSAIRDFGAREAHWEGLILYSANLVSGDVFAIDGIKYLVQSVVYDPASMETSWYAVKTNAVLVHKRFEEEVDEKYHIIGEWVTKNESVDAFGEIVTAELRQRDPGLLETTRYYFQVPIFEGDNRIVKMDRIVFDGTNYKVDAVNDIGMIGVTRIQLGVDVRGDGKDGS